MRLLPRVRQGGVTLLELLIAAAILAVIGAMMMSILLTTSNTYNSEVSAVTLDQNGRWAMDRITEDVRGAVASTRQIVVTGADTSVTFRPNVGYFGGALQLGNPITYKVQLMPGEIDDGLDNNGNGLIDERQLVRIQNGVTTAISPWVQKGGFRVVDLGQSLSITLVLEKTDGAGKTNQRTLTSQVQFRNP